MLRICQAVVILEDKSHVRFASGIKTLLIMFLGCCALDSVDAKCDRGVRKPTL